MGTFSGVGGEAVVIPMTDTRRRTRRGKGNRTNMGSAAPMTGLLRHQNQRCGASKAGVGTDGAYPHIR